MLFTIVRFVVRVTGLHASWGRLAPRHKRSRVLWTLFATDDELKAPPGAA